MIPEGTYTARLDEVDHTISRYRETPYTTLRLLTCGTDPTTLRVNVFGSIDNVVAWRKLIGTEFQVRVKHRTLDEETKDSRIILDTRIIR